MHMGIVAEQIAKALDGDDSACLCAARRQVSRRQPGDHSFMLRKRSEIGLQALPAAAAQTGSRLWSYKKQLVSALSL